MNRHDDGLEASSEEIHKGSLNSDETLRSSNDVAHPDSEIENAEANDEFDDASFSECVRFIKKVRQESPECLSGLVIEHPSPSRNVSQHNQKAKSLRTRDSDVLWMSTIADFPTQIGRFRIIRKLGEGGFGLVFLAFDPALDRQVALKVPRVEAMITEETRNRFLREGKAAARLDHKNIATVYEAGQIGPVCYIVSAYCPGASLAESINHAKSSDNSPSENGNPEWPFGPIASLILSLANAVHHAHERGILHRDLKPSNILFDLKNRVDSGEEIDTFFENLAANARIVDFGLAKSLDENRQGTRSGTAVGTASYMSPEQAYGDTTSIGPTTDIYSLGAILYELITGRPPFRKASEVETLVAVKSEDPIRPRSIRRACPKDLEAICLKCLEKDPHGRYSTASLLAEDLQQFLNGESVRARTPGLIVRSTRWCRRFPLRAVLVAIVVILATVGPLIAVNQNRLYQKAERAREEVRQTLYMSDMNLAFRDWEEANIERCGELLKRHLPSPGRSDHRGFEWFYLWRLWKATEQTPSVLYDPRLESIALSPNESVLAVGLYDGSVLLWDVRERRELNRWKAHPYRSYFLTFSPDGQTLASVNIDNEIKLWELPSCHEITCFAGARTVDFSPNGTALAYRLDRISIAIRDDWNASPRVISKAHSSDVMQVVFSPDGKQIASIGLDETVRIWNFQTGSLVGELHGLGNSGWRIDWSPDGNFVAAGDVFGGIKIWDTKSGDVLCSIAAHRATVSSMTFAPDSDLLASAAEDNTACLWEVPSGRRLRTMRGHFGEINSILFNNGGDQLLTASSDGHVKRWTVDWTIPPERLEHPRHVTSFAFADSGAILVTCCADKRLRFWDLQTSQLRDSVVANTDSYSRICSVNIDGQEGIACTGQDGVVRVFDVESRGRIREFRTAGHQGGPLPIATTIDQSLLAFSDAKYSVAIWDPSNDEVLNRLTVGNPRDIQFLADAKTIAVAGAHEISFWNFHTSKKIDEIFVDHRDVKCLAASHDRRLLASGSMGRTVELFKINDATEEPTLLHSLSGPGAPVDAIAISPDGKIAASSGADQVIRLWDIESGKQRASLAGHVTAVSALCFSPDGHTLLSASDDAVVRIWRSKRYSD